MNAQEAIKHKQRYVDSLKSRLVKLEEEIEKPYVDDEEFVEMCKSNYEALQKEWEIEYVILESAKQQEQAYIERMLLESNCEFCRGNHKHIMRQEIENYEDYDNDVCTIRIDEENYLCFEDSYHAHQQEIMFCPMCGRKLREGASE